MIELAINIFFIVLIASIIIVFITLVSTKCTMHKTDRILRKNRIFPSGASLRHGLVRAEDGSGEVLLDSQPSLTWYRRLV